VDAGAAQEAMPTLKEILGAMIFAVDRPLSVREMRKCLIETAQRVGGETLAFEDVRETDIAEALEELSADVQKARVGFAVSEASGGMRLESRPACGPWLRQLLDRGRPSRLSQPALETLAIVAYRQPVARSEIEAVRGVNVDHVMRSLLELQLVRIVGRSDLPGRPFLYGTTRVFLDHFGLRSLDDLKEMGPGLFGTRNVLAGKPGKSAGPEAETQGPETQERRPEEGNADGTGEEGDGPG